MNIRFIRVNISIVVILFVLLELFIYNTPFYNRNISKTSVDLLVALCWFRKAIWTFLTLLLYFFFILYIIDIISLKVHTFRGNFPCQIVCIFQWPTICHRHVPWILACLDEIPVTKVCTRRLYFHCLADSQVGIHITLNSLDIVPRLFERRDSPILCHVSTSRIVCRQSQIYVAIIFFELLGDVFCATHNIVSCIKGISCMTPCAPAQDTALASKLDSALSIVFNKFNDTQRVISWVCTVVTCYIKVTLYLYLFYLLLKRFFIYFLKVF